MMAIGSPAGMIVVSPARPTTFPTGVSTHISPAIVYHASGPDGGVQVSHLPHSRFPRRIAPCISLPTSPREDRSRRRARRCRPPPGLADRHDRYLAECLGHRPTRSLRRLCCRTAGIGVQIPIDGRLRQCFLPLGSHTCLRSGRDLASCAALWTARRGVGSHAEAPTIECAMPVT
jgi:hypothetical protein